MLILGGASSTLETVVRNKTDGREEFLFIFCQNVQLTQQCRNKYYSNILILIVSPNCGSVHSRNYSRPQTFTDHFCLNGNCQQLRIDSLLFSYLFLLLWNHTFLGNHITKFKHNWFESAFGFLWIWVLLETFRTSTQPNKINKFWVISCRNVEWNQLHPLRATLPGLSTHSTPP